MSLINYFNTTGLGGPALKSAQQNAIGQKQIIYAWAVKRKEPFTAWVVGLKFRNYPITSVRRAINRLVAEQKLVIIGKRVSGPYQKECFSYVAVRS